MRLKNGSIKVYLYVVSIYILFSLISTASPVLVRVLVFVFVFVGVVVQLRRVVLAQRRVRRHGGPGRGPRQQGRRHHHHHGERGHRGAQLCGHWARGRAARTHK